MNPHVSSPLPIEQAIAWAVRLASGSATDDERARCATWRAAAPAHEAAWAHVQALEDSFTAISPDHVGLAAQTLRDAATLQAVERRRVLKRLGSGAIGMLLAAMVMRGGPWWQTQRLTTALGARRREELADGTVLHLNTASNVDARLTLLRRLIVLHTGEIYIDTGSDPVSPVGRRPFWVHTRQARLEALGTRFGVIQRHDETVLYVHAGAVAIHPEAHIAAPVHLPTVVVRPGERYVIGNGDGLPIRLDDPSRISNDWKDGVLVAKRMRLDAFIAELARYHLRPIYCAPDVAGLQVSGVFQLDGDHVVDRAIDALTRSLPLRAFRESDGAVSLVRAR